jgi:hypothetical protein
MFVLIVFFFFFFQGLGLFAMSIHFGGSISLVNGPREWNPIETGLRLTAPTAHTNIYCAVCLDSQRDGVVLARKMGPGSR